MGEAAERQGGQNPVRRDCVLDMPIFFKCSDPKYEVYMGKDKFENEELLKYGFPEDIWFHVDKYSSAHVYLRLPPGSVDMAGIRDKEQAKQKLVQALESVPQVVIDEMCQLTKANSIEGCKLAQCDIVYTPFLNLKKEERMDTGQVGFKDEGFRKLLRNVEKDKEVVKRLEKTREEKAVDLAAEREQRDAEERARRKQFYAEEKQKQKEEEKLREEEKERLRNGIAGKMGTVEDCRAAEEDDFA